jgi:peptidoglycan-associated lipoprotein
MGPYDDEDGRNNPWALDPYRIIVGGGLSEESADGDPQDLSSAVEEFLAKQPSITKDFTKGTKRDGLKYEGDPQYLHDHPALVDFLNQYPNAYDMVFQPDELKKSLVAHPTSTRTEPVGHIHLFRFARSAESESTEPLSNFSVGFAADSYSPDLKSITRMRRFAESWMMHPPQGRTIYLAGNTDELGSTEFDLALGENLANSVKQILANEGVPPTSMRTVSFGKERPSANSFVRRSFYLFPKDDRVDLEVK